MQITALSIAFFSALATASHQHGQYSHHRRHLNVSSSAADEMTTLTVFTTNIRTITSCAHTVTNCPADAATHVNVVTDTIALTTTICPVTAAEAAASSAIAAVGGSTTSRAIIPLSTGSSGAGSGTKDVNSGYGVGASAEDSTLTYTLGSGSSSTVVTTTIKRTTTTIEHITVYKISSTEAAVATPIGDVAAFEPAVEPTTTITGYSTTTRYITVHKVKSVFGSAANAYNNAAVTGGVGDSGSCVPVTVTIAQTTIYATVTYTPMAASPTVPEVFAVQVTSEASPSTTEAAAVIPSRSVNPTTTTLAPSASGGSPYGYSNGTEPFNHKSSHHHHGGSSGFLTKSKPTSIMNSSAPAASISPSIGSY